MGTITQLLLLGELAPRAGASRDQPRAPHRAQPRAGRAVPLGRSPRRRPLGPARRVPGTALSAGRRRVVLAGDPGNRQPALRTLAANATTEEHWAVLEEAADASARLRPRLADGRPARRARAARRRRRRAAARARRRPRRRDQATQGARRQSRRGGQGSRLACLLRRLRRARESRHPRARGDLLAAGAVRAAGAVHPPLSGGAASPQGRHAQPGRGDPGDVSPRRRRRVVPGRGRSRPRRTRRSARTPATSCARSRSCSGGCTGPGSSEPHRAEVSTPRVGRRRCRCGGDRARRSGS